MGLFEYDRMRLTELHTRVPARELSAAVRRTTFAANPSNSGHRKLEGCNLTFDGQSIGLVCANDHVLTRQRLTGTTDASGLGAREITVDANLLRKTMALFPKSKNSSLNISVGHISLGIQSPDNSVQVILPRIEGGYFDWRGLLPKPVGSFDFTTDKLTAALGELWPDKGLLDGSVLAIRPGPDETTVQLARISDGTEIQLDVTHNQLPFEICLDPAHIAQILKHTQPGTMKMAVEAADKPALLTTPDNNSLYMVLPMV